MKKENVLKVILTKCLVGIPLGVTLLMIAYAGIYFIAGESVFVSEISQLQNIKILIAQMITASIAWYLGLINFQIIIDLQNKEKEYSVKNRYKTVVLLLVIELVLLFATVELLRANIFSENIKDMNTCILVICYGFVGLIMTTILTMLESNLIKKINKKLKEKNS